jgi:2-hydroxy-3-keto-5-methylthiopentenyl-1-phosphate phosphatase
LTTFNVVFDFDSTLATSFVGGEMFYGHAPEKGMTEARDRFHSDKTSLRQYQEEVFDLVDESTYEMSKRAAGKGSVRPLATEVCNEVWAAGGTVAVASAGLDFYIQPVLSKAGLDQIEIHSGRIVSEPTELPPFRYDYPSTSTTCKGDWVTCKCEVINRLKIRKNGRNGEAVSEVIFVGDGVLSDMCAAANAADTVFATGRLLDYCNENGIPSTEFGDDFSSVLSYVMSKTSSNGAK